MPKTEVTEENDGLELFPPGDPKAKWVLPEVDSFVARLACEYIRQLQKAREQTKEKADAAGIGRAAERTWKDAIVGTGKGQIRPGDVYRIQTGVDGESGGGDLRNQRMFDFVFRREKLIVCLEVQTTDYKGHKGPQLFAQLLHMREVASAATLFYKVIGQMDGHPCLFGWTQFDRRRRDLSHLLDLASTGG